MTDSDFPIPDEFLFEEWDPEEYEPPEPPAWRRPLIIGVALLTVFAMAAVPIYNWIGASQPRTAPNGLEVCSFDYCVVHEAMIAAGLDLSMSRYANLRLDNTETATLAAALTDYLGTGPVSVVLLDQLQGGVDGSFDPSTRTIFLQRPVSVWTVIHEVAHTEATGHGEEFIAVLTELTEWLDASVVD